MAIKICLKTIRGSIYETTKVLKFMPLLRPKKNIPLPKPLPSQRTKSKSSLKIENNIIEDNITKDVRNCFKLKNQNEEIKDNNINFKGLFESKIENYGPVRVGNFCSNN